MKPFIQFSFIESLFISFDTNTDTNKQTKSENQIQNV